MSDTDLEDIRRENFNRIGTARRAVMIVEIDGVFEVHEHTENSVFPPSRHETKRAAASRALQLLGIGPVAPQTWPESVCIGSVTREEEP